MSEAVFDKKRKIKESLWLILAFIPFFNFLGFLYVGYKAKRRAWTNRGILFGVLNFAAAVAMTPSGVSSHESVLCLFIESTRNLESAELAVRVFLAVIFAAALVMELALNSDYLKLRGIMTAGEKPAHELVRNRAWRAKQLIPLVIFLFVVLPLMSSISELGSYSCVTWRSTDFARNAFALAVSAFPILYAAERIDEKKWNRLPKAYFISAVVMTAIGVSAFIFFADELKSKEVGQLYGALSNVCSVITLFLTVTAFLLCLLWKESYLERLAPEYTYERQKYQCINSVKWRLLNSWWLLLCANIYSSGAALIYEGIAARKKRNIFVGIAALALIAGTALPIIISGSRIFDENANTLASFGLNLQDMVYYMAVLLAFLSRPTYLSARAKLSNGYASDVEREIDEMNALKLHEAAARKRMQAEPETDTADAPPAVPGLSAETRTVDIPEQVIDSAPAVETAQGVIDINSCTAQEMTRLPGITIVDAKRAVEHRETQGRFKSVDEFISFLKVKPHFAVGIFEMAEAGGSAAAAEEPKKPLRRRLDI